MTAKHVNQCTPYWLTIVFCFLHGYYLISVRIVFTVVVRSTLTTLGFLNQFSWFLSGSYFSGLSSFRHVDLVPGTCSCTGLIFIRDYHYFIKIKIVVSRLVKMHAKPRLKWTRQDTFFSDRQNIEKKIRGLLSRSHDPISLFHIPISI